MTRLKRNVVELDPDIIGRCRTYWNIVADDIAKNGDGKLNKDICYDVISDFAYELGSDHDLFTKEYIEAIVDAIY